MVAGDRELKAFLHERMYRHARVTHHRDGAKRVVRELFELYTAEPDRMPPEWRERAASAASGPARVVADFIAGMTDRYAFAEHARNASPSGND